MEKKYLINMGHGSSAAGVVSVGDATYETPMSGGGWIRSYAYSLELARQDHEALAKTFGQKLGGETVVSSDN